MRRDFSGGRVEVVHVRVPFRQPIQTSAGTWTHRDSWIVRLFDGPSAFGVGEAALDGAAGAEGEAEMRRMALEVAATVGWEFHLAYGTDPDPAAAVRRAWGCAVGSALVDLGIGSPPGPPATSVAVNATIGFGGPDAMAAAAAAAVARGFETLKLKAGPEIDTADLVRRVAAVRQAAGSDVRLRIDVNGAWDAATAVERLNALAPFEPEFVEQPVASGDASVLAAVRGASPVPIALDESVRSVAAARELLAAGAADVLVVKPSRVGGPMEAWEIAAMAADAGVPVVVSTLFETGIGLAAASVIAATLPRVRHRPHELAHGLATADLLESDLFADTPEISGGRLAVPAGSGWGAALDEAALRRYAVEWLGEQQ
jgi:o-succinylbenzoate synthase